MFLYNNRLLKRAVCLLATTLICMLLFSTSAFVAQQNVEFFAGSGELDYKDGSLMEAGFRFPYGMAVDTEGNLIVVDSYNNAVRKLDNKAVQTIAGGFTFIDLYGFPIGGLVDGPVSKSRFNRPRGVAVDSKGQIFIADTDNHVIRRIANGEVNTIAGNGKAGYKDGKGKDAQFNRPAGIAIDKEDNLYITDMLNQVIRKITPNGDVSTFAGVYNTKGGYKDGNANQALFNEPAGITIDGEGVLYVIDGGNQVIRKISHGQVSTYAGGFFSKIAGTDYYEGGYRDGIKSKALFNFPKGITVTEKGTVFIADTWNHRIRAIKPDGTVITIAGTGSPGELVGVPGKDQFNGPVDVLFHSGYLYISDMWNNSIRRMKIDEDHLIPIIENTYSQVQFDPVSEGIQVWVDGVRVNFPDAQPFIEEGRTIVPLRFICEAWGAEVSWKEETRQVIIKRGEQETILDVDIPPVFIRDNRAVVQIRFLAETFGFSVNWVPEYRGVVIKTE